MTAARDSLWDRHRRQWEALGSPLRPCPEDLALYSRCLDEWRSAAAPGPDWRALVLGVTPEFPRLDWPPGCRLYAVDNSANMIRHLWPAGVGAAAGALRADWLSVPLPDGAAGVIVGDGCFSLMPWPEGYRRLARSIARLLAPDGRLILRCFTRPPRGETPERVFDDLFAGRIGGFHAFKWRLAMALHGDGTDVRVHDVWQAWQDRGCTEAGVAAITGWPAESIRTLAAYRDAGQRLSFPTLDQLRAALEGLLVEVGCAHPGYELGDRCPILSFRRRS